MPPSAIGTRARLLQRRDHGRSRIVGRVEGAPEGWPLEWWAIRSVVAA